MKKWITNSVFYHIYPLGFCGAPKNNEETEPVNRIEKVIEWIPHIKSLNANAIYFGPVFYSDRHGYDTNDYTKIDWRLGTNEDFKKVCDALHENGIKVVLDGVFNHVGRNFWAFKDVKEKGQASPYCSWFSGIDFSKQSPMGDNFTYDSWEGHYTLVKLNLKNQDVCNHLLSAVGGWIEEFGIDGIRLDAADCVDIDFFRQLVDYTKKQKDDFWLMAEIIHGDYTRWANPDLLDSVTNYECYKGIWSSHNDKNYFEIAYSLNRQFGAGGIYKDIYSYNFVDNHDVVRLASIIKKPEYIKNCYTLVYTMPGVPSVYYGSEYGIKGDKSQNDDLLRPCLELNNIPDADEELFKHIAKLGEIRLSSKAFASTQYKQILVKNEQLVYMRECDGQSVYIALNLDDKPYSFEIKLEDGIYIDLLSGEEINVKKGKAEFEVEAYSSRILTHKEN